MAMNGSLISQTREAVWEGHIWATPVGSPLEKVHAQGLERASSLVQSLIGMNIALYFSGSGSKSSSFC